MSLSYIVGRRLYEREVSSNRVPVVIEVRCPFSFDIKGSPGVTVFFTVVRNGVTRVTVFLVRPLVNPKGLT